MAGGSVVVASGYTKPLMQGGLDQTGTTAVITFPQPFKAGTTPGVFLTPFNTGASGIVEAPIVNLTSTTSCTIIKKAQSGSSLTFVNYPVFWFAIGEAP